MGEGCLGKAMIGGKVQKKPGKRDLRGVQLKGCGSEEGGGGVEKQMVGWEE